MPLHLAVCSCNVFKLALVNQKKDMRTLSVLLLMTLVTAFTCRKTESEEDRYTTYSYKQTQCADPWQAGSGSGDSLTIVKVTNYLTAAGLHVARVQIKADDIAAVCLACQCKTGKTIYVTSFSDDSTKARFLRLGFQQ
jgi:hypothetical protein